MFKTIDLFAGAGGLSLGFKQTGRFELVAAAEINPNAQATYKENIPTDPDNFKFIDNVIGCDFRALSEELGVIEIVIGGPPCQGFSNANRQKNQLINMNNALVKEYFRAIKEIRPIAFVMENVSMLESDTHRFYDSHNDHDEIEALRTQGYAIPTRDDEIFISKDNFIGFDMLDIAMHIETVESIILPNELYVLIRVLNKNKNNKKRLPNFLQKNKNQLIKQIDKYIEIEDNQDSHKIRICEMLQIIKAVLPEAEALRECAELSSLVELQKNLISIREIYQNRLIGDYKKDTDNNVVFATKSYSVIDYINAILGNQYIQKGATLNAEWFGVPQERRRHIIIGLRKDDEKEIEISFPTESVCDSHYTVADAIMDLAEYPVSLEKTCDDIPYTEDQLSEYAREMRLDSTTVKNHIATKTTETAMERFKAIEQGKNFHSLDAELKTTYSDPTRTQNTIYLRLDPNAPSGTVVNVRKSMWIHPTLDRAVTVREAARLQSFPDKFKFIGTKDSQYQQVGNAVPPKLARGIADIILGLIQ